MRRADRLFRLVQILRGGRVHTAASLAEELEVSERTLYRDVRDLMASGVPIEGEAGVGYVMQSGFDLPPLMFTSDEVEALVMGARMVEAWADPVLAKSAAAVLSKVRSVLPPALANRVENVPLFALDFHVPDEARKNLEPVRVAISGRNLLRFAYKREDGLSTERVVRPLGLYFWGKKWTFAAWCELRRDFRNFRPDRMSAIEVLKETFPVEEERELATFLARFEDC
jgi:predicted DNA-binding transcriptional regulator YafY